MGLSKVDTLDLCFCKIDLPKGKILLAAGETILEHVAAHKLTRVGSRDSALEGVQRQWPRKLWGFTCFECLRRALLDLYYGGIPGITASQ